MKLTGTCGVLILQNGNACGPGYPLIRLQAFRARPVPVSIPIAGIQECYLTNSQTILLHAAAQYLR